MLKRIFVLLLAITSCVAWSADADFVRTPVPEGHPIIGRWRADLPELKCFEEHEVRADGTRSVIAAEERSESEFKISAVPNASGYYVWIDKIIKNNGKPDCSASLTDIGHVATAFVLMHPTRERFLMCFEENMKSCVAEFIRQK